MTDDRRRPRPTSSSRQGASSRSASTQRSGRPQPSTRTTSGRTGSTRPQGRPAQPRTVTRRRKVRRHKLGRFEVRLRVLALVLAVAFSGVAMRAMQIQVVDAPAQAAEAAKQLTRTRTLPAQRGSISDRSGELLAFTEDTVNVIADPSMIAANGKEAETQTEADKKKAAQAPTDIAQIVARHTGGNATELEQTLRNPPSPRYVVLAKQVSASSYLALRRELVEGGYVGVFKESNPRRVYPMGTVASNLVGFVAEGKGGQAGIEYSREAELAGTPGKETFETSPNGKIPLGDQVLVPAVNGKNIQLTIDSEMQWMAERRLAQGVAAAKGTWGVAVVLDIETGQILALANYPSFDSNQPGKTDLKDLGNRAVGASYEPGSVQKVLTMASLLDAGVVEPDTWTRIGGEIEVGDNKVKDAFKHGDIDITARGVIVKSSNVGAITLARRLDKAQFVDYMAKFGLGKKTGLGLPGEASGTLPKAKMPDYQRDSLAYGYGASVTSVQMASAVAAIANGGVYNAPSIIKSTTDSEGRVTEAPAPESHRVVSEKAARETVEMMEQAAIHYYDKVGVEGYRTGVKTGTARLSSGGGYKGQVASIIGVGPVEDPQVLVYVLVGRPDQQGAGLSMAGPTYRDLMSIALPRYGVRPSSEKMLTELPTTR